MGVDAGVGLRHVARTVMDRATYFPGQRNRSAAVETSRPKCASLPPSSRPSIRATKSTTAGFCRCRSRSASERHAAYRSSMPSPVSWTPSAILPGSERMRDQGRERAAQLGVAVRLQAQDGADIDRRVNRPVLRLNGRSARHGQADQREARNLRKDAHGWLVRNRPGRSCRAPCPSRAGDEPV